MSFISEVVSKRYLILVSGKSFNKDFSSAKFLPNEYVL